MLERLETGFSRLITALCTTAIERHDALARVLDYLTPPRTLRVILLVLSGVCLLPDGVGDAVFLTLWMVLYLGLIATFHLTMRGQRLVLAFWEVLLWLFVFAAIISLADLFGGVGHDAWLRDFADLLGDVIRYVILTYLLVDLTQPPRKRKRIKMPAKQPKSAYEGIIT